MKKIKVGLIQQSNTADIRVNLMNLAKSIEACAAHGAQLIRAAGVAQFTLFLPDRKYESV